ncbi:MAG: sugar transferase [bacterium]
MKKIELIFTAIQVPLDFIMVVLAGISAYYIRFAEVTKEIRPVIFNLPFIEYLQILLIIAAAWVMVFIFSGLYNIRKVKRLRDELRRVILACSLGLVLVVVVIFFFRELFSSRFIVLAGWILSIIYLSMVRMIIAGIKRWLYQHDIGVRKIVMVGNSQTTDNLIKEFAVNKALGFCVVRRLSNFFLETSNELSEYLKHHEIDEIIQSDPNLSKAEVLRLYDFADENHIIFKYAADLLGTKVLRVDINEISGVPIVEVKKTPLDGWGRILKRTFDIFMSGILIVLTSLVTIPAAIMIKLDSHGPVFFSKLDDGSPLHRIGQAGRPFRYLKFRSMKPNTDSLRYTELAEYNIRKGGPMVKIKDDPRITRVGKFIRRFSIDELPELFLVFVGKMSLVGPRPHLPEEVAKYEGHHKKVLTIKPGVTGFAQVSGRSDLTFEEEVKLDVYYIENWSLWRDLVILFKTPVAVLKSRKTE